MSHALKYVLFSLAMAIGAAVVVLAEHGYPMPVFDEDAFVLPAVNYARGEGLTNGSFIYTSDFDPVNHRMIYHGFLEPLLIGKTLPPEHAERTYIARIGLIIAIDILLAACVILRVTTLLKSEFGKLAFFTSVFCLGAIAALLWTHSVRPEVFAAGIVLCAAFALTFVMDSPWFCTLILGASAGLCATASPLSGVFAGMLAAVFASARFPPRRALGATLLAGIMAVGTCWLVAVTIYPFPFSDWIYGVAKHGRMNGFLLPTVRETLMVMVVNPLCPFIGPLCVLVVAVLWLAAKRHLNPLCSKTYFAGSAGLAFLLFCYFLTGGHPRTYNPLPFLVLGLAVAAVAVQTVRPALKIAVLLSMLVMASGALRSLALAVPYLQHGINPETAHDLYLQSGVPQDAKLGIAASAIYFLDSYDNVVLAHCNLIYSPAENRKFDFLIAGQQYSGRTTPPEIEGFDLVVDHFVRESPRLLGIPIGHSMPGYAFAVYRSKKYTRPEEHAAP